MIIGNYSTSTHYYKIARKYQYSNKLQQSFAYNFETLFKNKQCTKIITDLTPIFGFAMCDAALKLKLPIKLQLPFKKFYVSWSDDLQQRVLFYLNHKNIEIKYTDTREFGRWKININNEKIVSQCDLILSLKAPNSLDTNDTYIVNRCKHYESEYWNLYKHWQHTLNKFGE